MRPSAMRAAPPTISEFQKAQLFSENLVVIGHGPNPPVSLCGILNLPKAAISVVSPFGPNASETTPFSLGTHLQHYVALLFLSDQ